MGVGLRWKIHGYFHIQETDFLTMNFTCEKTCECFKNVNKSTPLSFSEKQDIIYKHSPKESLVYILMESEKTNSCSHHTKKRLA